MEITLTFVLVVVICYSVSCGEYNYGSVYCSAKKCTYKKGVLDYSHSTAVGVYNDTLMETGWGILDIISGNGKPADDIDIMYAAGYIEGALTAPRIYQHYLNIKDIFLKDMSTQAITDLKEFLKTQDKWMRKQIESITPKDPLWRHVAMVIAQYDGLVDGYKATAEQDLEVFAFQVLNGAGDLIDLVKALNPASIPNWRAFTPAEARSYVQRTGMCSALIKVLGAYEDIFMSHSSWFEYQATMRIYKHYNFNVKDSASSAKKISFSSYPGFLESLDDFYLMSSNMVMLQTTNNVFNQTLYKLVQPQSLLAWQRVRVANMMASSGKQWADVFSLYNSGTYNNQYMIIDMKKISLGKSIDDNALWIVEQIPSLVKSADTTSILRTGYWPSYNVPFFEEIYNMSGYPGYVAQHGTEFSYQLAPRAKIFRRDEGKVVDLMSMKKIMRYNDYENDPYSEGDSCNAICCRGDLKKDNPRPDGCYDTKVSNLAMAMNFTADIINGPTRGTDLPVFVWSDVYKQSHVGLPEKYDFNFIRTAPKWNV
ncbi:phospholipase B-like 1 [Mytilus galloprovincialis]|uniref:phospholipase B-like 1 n=1 Tax=Mytilus galloprovincialis TaxID=29158 RepID=UPI003F7C13C3